MKTQDKNLYALRATGHAHKGRVANQRELVETQMRRIEAEIIRLREAGLDIHCPAENADEILKE